VPIRFGTRDPATVHPPVAGRAEAGLPWRDT